MVCSALCICMYKVLIIDLSECPSEFPGWTLNIWAVHKTAYHPPQKILSHFRFVLVYLKSSEE